MDPEISVADVHPIDMLIDLVVSEELDPWDIDIEEIANKFLEKINRMQRINLRLSGRTLLTSSILLRMKSEDLLPPPEEWEDEIEDFDWDLEYDDYDAPPLLEIPMQRRTEQSTSLFELVDALQRALSEETLRKNFPERERAKRILVLQVDEEDIKERIEKTFKKIRSLAKSKNTLLLSDIISEETRSNVVETIVTLLYLDTQQRIRIWQEKLFGEIFISLR
ncbi:MAG: segregation/condensation protein A [Candidatus Hydrothermarchaeales archaeon]